MSAMLRRTILLLIFLTGSAWLAAGEPVFIYLVRHAEKVDDSRDPDLSAAGQARAEALAAFFAEIELDALFATELKRTQQTIEPIAKVKSLSLTIHPARDSASLAGRLRAMAGKTVLVSGHSNTVPAIIAALGGSEVAIGDDDYDNLFLVVIVDGEAYLQRFRFHMR